MLHTLSMMVEYVKSVHFLKHRMLEVCEHESKVCHINL